MLKVLWLNSDQLGCGTYRCYVPALSLQESQVADSSFLAHHLVTDPLPLHELDDMDVVVFQRAVGTAFVDFMKECQRREIATVFELDDNIFDVPRHNPAGWFWRRKPIQKILRQQLDMADRVLVSTTPLKETVIEAMGWKGSEVQKIRLCPNHLHPAVWGKNVWGSVLPYKNTGLVIGWQGSTTHDTDFKEALIALRLILDKYPQVLLRFLGCVPLSVKGVIPEHRFQWTRGVEMERYPATLRFVNYDIGIAPVTDSLFNRSKSNIKWLEYSALGVPCVAARVYPYAKSIVDGTTGFLAGSHDEWFEKLQRLVEDATLRQQIGLAAQQTVWADWSHERHAPKWAEALLSARRTRSLDTLIGGPDVADPEFSRATGTGE